MAGLPEEAFPESGGMVLHERFVYFYSPAALAIHAALDAGEHTSRAGGRQRDDHGKIICDCCGVKFDCCGLTILILALIGFCAVLSCICHCLCGGCGSK